MQFCTTCFTERLLDDWFTFLCHLGVHWKPWGVFCFVILGILFQRSIFKGFVRSFWEVPAAGAGRVKYTEYADSGLMSAHALRPLRGAANLKASPLTRSNAKTESQSRFQCGKTINCNFHFEVELAGMPRSKSRFCVFCDFEIALNRDCRIPDCRIPGAAAQLPYL